ncbi:hypothetical protein M422DRAFT_252446 [Sphaerobolus stellatus SS14]|uniref:Unplaced genomic scaffold SPHSTscaffold_44, whole genome shotgun sequence n=1 Tax=Sphaerobolus stellatus (strain SS14) TaxID=990650 RepID=A0A0C9ULR1_SPHS4|nr:hypothetical protein M422DRAFT_779489 [Sphaerobolus stellatus SS14]KIJ43950.1 hypothetical protein M422DRAFT_252446 [Sphaerobolus stellatus SS14]
MEGDWLTWHFVSVRGQKTKHVACRNNEKHQRILRNPEHPRAHHPCLPRWPSSSAPPTPSLPASPSSASRTLHSSLPNRNNLIGDKLPGTHIPHPSAPAPTTIMRPYGSMVHSNNGGQSLACCPPNECSPSFFVFYDP